MTEPTLFIGVSDLAMRLNLRRARADQLANEPGFPAPLPGVPRLRIYPRVQVEDWIAHYRPWQGLSVDARNDMGDSLLLWAQHVCASPVVGA